MPGIGAIYNPRSGYNLRNPSAGGRLVRAIGSAGVVRGVDSIATLYQVAEEFRDLGVDLLAISGGDGTNGVTIGAFLDVYGDRALPPVALLRGGTANTLADSLGVRRGPPERLLAQLVATGGRSRPLREIRRAVMRVRADNARRSDGVELRATMCGFLFGVGAVCGYLQEYYASGEPSPTVAAQTLLRAIGSTLIRGPMIRRITRPFHGAARFDDGTTWEERDYLSVAAGTVEHIGLGFKPFYRASERTDAFHVLGIHARPLGFIRQLDRIWKGRAMRPGHAYERLTARLWLESTARPLGYMLDGDLYACDGGLEVELGPVVRLVVAD